jgi:ribonucleoside-diphosphate reductase alpha chain
MSYGPKVPESDAQHASKYRGPGESFEEACNRVASGLAVGEQYKPFREVLLDMRFLPGGRIQSAIGSARNVTPYNCFVSGTIADSLRQGDSSITKRLDEALGTLQMGGGIGYDFSELRFRGAEIRKLRTHSAGPIPFMGIFDAACRCISAAGHRRGAQMGVLRVDHPDIEEFVHAKQKEGALEAFNISVAVTDEFMEAVKTGSLFWLRFNGQNIRQVDARALWEKIMRSTWDWAEPGVLFIDRINGMNNLHYCERIAATNPCGEQPLPPYGACLLGSFNMVKYLSMYDHGGADGLVFDETELVADVPKVVRAMDRVIDVATYPLWEQEQEAKNKRRMGLGITGAANAFEALGCRYGDSEFLHYLRRALTIIRDEAYRASIELAKEKGPFPLYDSRYWDSKFVKTLPDDIQEGIHQHGIRNSHLLSIAPTGTISLCADNVSSGIEPVFAYEIDRAIIGSDQVQKIHRFQDYGVRFLKTHGKVSSEVTAEEHLSVLAVASELVDSAVSKTCNVDGSMPWEEFKAIYFKAWERGCKGCTTYNKDGKRGAVLVEVKPEGVCRIDPETGRKECE